MRRWLTCLSRAVSELSEQLEPLRTRSEASGLSSELWTASSRRDEAGQNTWTGHARIRRYARFPVGSYVGLADGAPIRLVPPPFERALLCRADRCKSSPSSIIDGKASMDASAAGLTSSICSAAAIAWLAIGLPDTTLLAGQSTARIYGQVRLPCNAGWPALVTLTRTDISDGVVVTARQAWGPLGGVDDGLSDGAFFDAGDMPPGTYTIRATPDNAFLPIVREGVVVSAGETRRLDLVMDFGPRLDFKNSTVLTEPASDVHSAAAIVRLRFGSAGAPILWGGRPTIEYRVTVLDVVKPFRPRESQPGDRDVHPRPLVRGDVATMVQYDAGSLVFEGLPLEGMPCRAATSTSRWLRTAVAECGSWDGRSPCDVVEWSFPTTGCGKAVGATRWSAGISTTGRRLDASPGS